MLHEIGIIKKKLLKMEKDSCKTAQENLKLAVKKAG